MNQDTNNYYPPTSPGLYPQVDGKQAPAAGPYTSQVNDFSQYPAQNSKYQMISIDVLVAASAEHHRIN